MFHVILFEHREKQHAGWPRGDLMISRNRMTQARSTVPVATLWITILEKEDEIQALPPQLK